MKQPEEMTADEALAEFQHLDNFFMDCQAAMHGISTKEFARFKLVCDRLVQLGKGREAESSYYHCDAQMHALIWADSIAAIKRGRSQLAKAG